MTIALKSNAAWRFWAGWGMALLGAGQAAAQEALRSNLNAAQAASQTRSEIESAAYTARWGDLRLLISPSVAFEWSDNIRLQETHPEADFLLTPRVNFHALHPVGEANALSFDVGVGYSKYLEHDELDQLIVSPGSALSFDVFVKSVRLNVHDRFTYQLDPVLSGAVSGTGRQGGINNAAGVTGTWALEKASVELGYDFVKFISSDAQFEYLDRSTHQMLARFGVQVHPALTLGVEGTDSPTTYDRSFLNDNTGYSAGAYAEWQASEQLSIAPRAGYSLYTFTPNASLGAPADYGAYYFGLQLDHKLNESVTYNLAVDRQIQPGVSANLSDLWTARAAVQWAVIRHLPLSTEISYEHGKEVARGLLLDRYDRFGGRIGVQWHPMEKATLGLSYQLYLKDSELPGRDYLQNRVTLTVGYQL